MSTSFSVPSIFAIVSAIADAPSGEIRPSAITAARRTALSSFVQQRRKVGGGGLRIAAGLGERVGDRDLGGRFGILERRRERWQRPPSREPGGDSGRQRVSLPHARLLLRAERVDQVLPDLLDVASRSVAPRTIAACARTAAELSSRSDRLMFGSDSSYRLRRHNLPSASTASARLRAEVSSISTFTHSDPFFPSRLIGSASWPARPYGELGHEENAGREERGTRQHDRSPCVEHGLEGDDMTPAPERSNSFG